MTIPDPLRAALEEAMHTALRRFGGIPAMARTPQGRNMIVATCAAEAIASIPAPETKTLRDELAMAALPALLSRHRADVAWSEVAPLAYQIADDMLKART